MRAEWVMVRHADLKRLGLPWGIYPQQTKDQAKLPKWRAVIRPVGLKTERSLGYFPTLEEAIDAKEKAVESFSWLEDRPWE